MPAFLEKACSGSGLSFGQRDADDVSKARLVMLPREGTPLVDDLRHTRRPDKQILNSNGSRRWLETPPPTVCRSFDQITQSGVSPDDLAPSLDDQAINPGDDVLVAIHFAIK